MAEQRSGSRRNGSSSAVSGPEAIARVRRDLPQMLGRPIESILGIERGGDRNGWELTVQVVELSRIPHSTDVLGDYWVTVDREGELLAYGRRRRYHRNQPDED